jgi:two-component system osmolarity sensor histidine kinase EnvZ
MFMRNQIRPIRRLALAAERFGKGRDVPNFRLEGALEVRQAAAAFLVMRERILRQIRQRTELLAGVSHDLRTPLTRMKLQLALMGDSPDVEELVADVSEMQAMVEGYLAFARGEGDESMQSTDLVRLIHEVAAGQRREGAEITLDLNASDIPMLPLRPNAMRRCLSNLVANARRHATHIWVSVVPRDYEMIDIFVDDNGSGIPRARREEVFKPFVRGDREQASPAGGTGLGLTIARDIARSHGGEITLADSPHGGLRAIIRLPL